MINEIKRETTELIIFFFILFLGLCMCDWNNKEMIHDRAVYESQFSTNCPIPDGFDRAIIDPDKKLSTGH